LNRVIWCLDRGFNSKDNRRYLQRAGGHYIVGEKLRSEQKEAAAALSRQGRYRVVAGNLKLKEVRVDDGVRRTASSSATTPSERSTTPKCARGSSPTLKARSPPRTCSARTSAGSSTTRCAPSRSSRASYA